jgi:hypothetical protein
MTHRRNLSTSYRNVSGHYGQNIVLIVNRYSRVQLLYAENAWEFRHRSGSVTRVASCDHARSQDDELNAFIIKAQRPLPMLGTAGCGRIG